MTLLQPWALLLLPLAAIPFILKSHQGQFYSWIEMVPADKHSEIANLLLKATISLLIICIVLALASPQGESKQEQKIGKGAQTVLVIDRSVSMDHPFAGQATGGRAAEIKSMAARRLITDFIDSRPDDMMGVVGFTNSALYGMKITANRDAIHAAIKAATGPALNQTNIGAGITQGVTLFDNIQSSGSRAVILLSDGAGKLSPRVKYKISQQLTGKKINLYWIVLREPDDISIFNGANYSDEQAPDAINLDRFFKSLNIKYKAFEADNPTTLESALREINAKEKNMIQYSVIIPGHDYANNLIMIAMVLSLLILLIKNLRIH
ncbi:vWA domain-containing protein [Methylotenera mobilis]|uniref:von Willebrand factor type A n=1 Tax=Methylotenera mobilis (strain JLW8 / ATCC BAA-1282 / DSM 17540) TaxID=583345 RepID=C6WVR3_METML|nr:vWA domain-containing protein [Methylotenera mobilis]ACT48012.1 von Willebrand factor type A [Methylotenera mobilis JLW8]